MTTFTIPQTNLRVSRLAIGCMNLGGSWGQEPIEAAHEDRAGAVIRTALDLGINFFDHADIYCSGKSETVFGRVLASSPGLRDRMILQSKAGIRFPNDTSQSGEPARYDFDESHLVAATEGILQRLGTDRLDLLLLHRPDPLSKPEEVAAAFDKLHREGKVRYFGVSNHSAPQIELLRRHVRQPLIVNQLEFSLLQPALVTEGIHVNQPAGVAESALSAGLLDYCRLQDMLVQAWSPLGGGKLFEPGHPVASLAAGLAKEKKVSPEAILLAWILRHPAGIQPIIGTTRVERVKAAAEADTITLSRQEWYALLAAARGTRVP